MVETKARAMTSPAVAPITIPAICPPDKLLEELALHQNYASHSKSSLLQPTDQMQQGGKQLSLLLQHLMCLQRI